MKYETVDRVAIERLVHTFYERVRADTFIGPIFNDVIGDRWGRHLATMVNFWSSVMLTSGVYKGTPMAKHVALTQVEPAHFDRWLELFEATTSELFVPAIADDFMVRARRIAESFQLGMFYKPDQIKVVNAPLP